VREAPLRLNEKSLLVRSDEDESLLPVLFQRAPSRFIRLAKPFRMGEMSGGSAGVSPLSSGYPKPSDRKGQMDPC
jgi:hypothetical protein